VLPRLKDIVLNLARIDLNLLVALEALLAEKSVTRAAERLHLTQPALSGSLQRLREQFNDHLLIRVGRDMELTPTARALIEPLREALLNVAAVLETQAVFDPATAKREFRIAMSDYLTFTLLPRAVVLLSKTAPGINCAIEPFSGPSLDRLGNGQLDYCITHDDWSLFGDADRHALRIAPLFSDELVCVVAQDHPLGDTLSLEDYLRYPHAIADFGADIRTLEQAALRKSGISVHENVSVPSFSALLLQLPGTHLIATVQRRMARLMRPLVAVRTFRPPVETSPLKEALIWHARNDTDPGHLWMRSVLEKIGGEIAAEDVGA
jgi:LysR family transcriptional regulator, nod-box dependent transcriptional activator